MTKSGREIVDTFTILRNSLMTTAHDRVLPHEADHERAARRDLAALLAATSIPQPELADEPVSLPVRQDTARCPCDGLAVPTYTRCARLDLRVRLHRGRHLATFTALRAHYKPYNPHRKIVGFDTFTGLPDVSGKDTTRSAAPGRFAVAREYPDHPREGLAVHERLEPLRHVRRTLVAEGVVRETLPQYLEDNPHTVVALAYFDRDLYEPTRGPPKDPPVPHQGQHRGVRRARPRQVARLDVRATRHARHGRLPAAPPARPRHAGLPDLGGATACGHALKPASASSASRLASTNSLSTAGLRSIASSESSRSGT
jgi:hypothetical protein